ncbi:MAG: M23 family metallopeptidase [Gemmatimonadetes bacterium]|nr:M23 family metallopeptidase [Gemmatimonadota bacterium]
MTRFVRRTAVVAVAVAGAAAALTYLPSVTLPTRSPAERLGLNRWHASDTLGKGESLAALLGRRGLDAGDAAVAVQSLDGLLDDRRIPAGLKVQVHGDTASTRATDVDLLLDEDRVIRLHRDGEVWSAVEDRIPWSTDTVLVRGVVHTNLYDALDAGGAELLSKGARIALAWEVADVYEYRIDMSRDLQDGDSVRVLFERSTNPSGTNRIGRVLAAGLERGGQEITAVRFVHPDGKAEFFDDKGRSLRASFLRAPLSFRRISSVFGRRKHPILGIWRQHAGTDYSAASGTPVRTIGDGVVIFAGHKGGYGNVLEIRHRNGFVTRYGHLKGFAKGIKRGHSVTQGETVAYVGMTGLATGPHLHFEVLVNGVQRDPRTALRQSAAVALAGRERVRFDAEAQVVLAELERTPGVVRAALVGDSAR